MKLLAGMSELVVQLARFRESYMNERAEEALEMQMVEIVQKIAYMPVELNAD